MIRSLIATLLAAGTAAALAAAPAEAADGSWHADLSTVDNEDVNVAAHGDGDLTLADAAWHRTALVTAGSEGSFLTAEHTLGAPADRVTADVAADVPAGTEVDVDIRGRTGTGDDDWTEWTPAGGTLSATVTDVQVRVALTTRTDGVAPSVHDVRLSADVAPQAAAQPLTAARTYRVYATREGLVGGTTANGHKIVSHDHFVSFPSGKSLSAKGSGSYTARVCKTDGSRCEYAPVWEVGPWNTKNDYWNPASQRAEYKDLPQGEPEAQAAYQKGYNGGRDDLGYKVGNPAGIDLADGVFLDGLALSDNSYVNVTYLWTGSGATGVVTTAGDPVNVRPSAHTSGAAKGLAANYAKVTIECYTEGDSVTGKLGTSKIWDRIGTGNFVSQAYVKVGATKPAHC